MPAKHSAKMKDETIIQYCMFNDFENKENQVVEFGFEGLTKPGKGLEIQPQGSDYCGQFTMVDEPFNDDKQDIFDKHVEENSLLTRFNELDPIKNLLDDESIASFLSDHDYNYLDR